MGSFPTRPFQESKPQNSDPDKFSSKPRRKTNIAPSANISTPTGYRRPAFATPQSTTEADESQRGYFHGKIRKITKRGKEPFF